MNPQRMLFSIKKSVGNFGLIAFIFLLILAISTDAFAPRSFLKRSDDKEASSIDEAQSQQKTPTKRLFTPQDNFLFQQQPQAKRFELADGYYDFPQQKRFDFLDSFYIPANGYYGGMPAKRFDYNSFGGYGGPRPMAAFL
uniref:Unknow n=1 Tax=Meloidogyne graminicola TaxID=189291 RepID=A0A515MD76_9BILA|nr:hypothetical protein [Meloidogyne graminicola]QSE03453.1 unknow [Meloidogyne graminicola]